MSRLGSSRPLIGILADVDEKGKIAISNRWARTVHAYGGQPILIPSNTTPRELLSQFFPKLDGILLPGGDSNVHPYIYGEEVRRHGQEFDPELDQIGIVLAQEAHRLDIPLLGICRGMQIMNAAFGGKIRDLDAVHATGYQDGKTRMHHQVHGIILTEQGELRRLFGSKATDVNSIHEQGMEEADMASQFIPEAIAPDGAVEAMQAPDKRHYRGVQFHPELGGNELYTVIFRNFIGKASAFAADKRSEQHLGQQHS